MNMVSYEPVFSLPVIRVNRGAFIFYTMLWKRSSRFSVNFRMILIETSTRGTEECFNLSHKMLKISYLSLSFYLSKLQRYKISKMQVCCHSEYSFSLLIKQKYNLGLKGIPPSEIKISSKAIRAFMETKLSESLMS